ncbi:MAG TPA: FkbM family methyltransferase [Chitinophagaceae bacterium]|nr:FkbM family methyltransferase [Chitinophagaceae bacterium]
MNFLSTVKQSIQRAIWPYGSVTKILRGHLKGYKFFISENSGWSPILGRWEPESHEIFVRMIKPGQTVFDLGANNGIHSMLFSRLVGDTGKVFAFEPLPSNITELEKNKSLNKITNIKVVAAAVGDKDGHATFYLGNLDKQGSIVGIGSQSGREVEVKLTTLKTFIETENVKPDFLKIDIEGAESDALKGMGDLISAIRPAFFIELHTPEQDKKVGEILQKFNYKVYRLTEKPAENDLNIPFLERVKNLNAIHPDPEGIWGTILALPGSDTKTS